MLISSSESVATLKYQLSDKQRKMVQQFLYTINHQRLLVVPVYDVHAEEVVPLLCTIVPVPDGELVQPFGVLFNPGSSPLVDDYDFPIELSHIDSDPNVMRFVMGGSKAPEEADTPSFWAKLKSLAKRLTPRKYRL